MPRCKVGVQLWPQHTSMDALREAWQAIDELGVDSLWVWDHFFPLFGKRDDDHFEGWTVLAAMAATTQHATLGALVGCNSYRNPDLLADMARTIDHISGGRAYLGIGSGWFERDYDEYGYDFGTGPSRLRDLEAALPRMKARLDKLAPRPMGRLPILIGGSGEKVTLRLVAQYADAWNTFGPAESWGAKNAILDEWCAKVGREPEAIERTLSINDPAELDQFDEFVAAGATHVILGLGTPFDLEPVKRLIQLARG